MTKKKYVVNLLVELLDTDTGEALETVTETEYFDTPEEAYRAVEKYNSYGLGEYSDGIKAALKAAEIEPEAQEIDFYY